MRRRLLAQGAALGAACSELLEFDGSRTRAFRNTAVEEAQ